jgi:hypothetical protein
VRSENGLRWALAAGETVFGTTVSPTAIGTLGAVGLRE